MSHRKIDSVMSTEVVTVREGTLFKDVARALAERDVSAVPVVDGDGRVLGVVSEADLLIKQGTQEIEFTRSLASWWRGRRNFRRAEAVRAADLMTTPPITVPTNATVAAAARLMTKHNVKRLPVLGTDGNLAGIVSRKDVLEVFLREDEEIRADIVEHVFEHGLGIAVNPASVTVAVHDGEVTLTGQLELKSQLGLVEDMTKHIDGVVDVVVSMTYRRDDTHGRLPDPMTIDITRP